MIKKKDKDWIYVLLETCAEISLVFGTILIGQFWLSPQKGIDNYQIVFGFSFIVFSVFFKIASRGVYK